MRARLRIDRTACVGSGLCEAMSPELFTIADDGRAEANETDLEGGRVEIARSVADCCPSGAIVLAETTAPHQEGTGR
jgi:ferredoxin